MSGCHWLIFTTENTNKKAETNEKAVASKVKYNKTRLLDLIVKIEPKCGNMLLVKLIPAFFLTQKFIICEQM